MGEQWGYGTNRDMKIRMSCDPPLLLIFCSMSDFYRKWDPKDESWVPPTRGSSAAAVPSTFIFSNSCFSNIIQKRDDIC